MKTKEEKSGICAAIAGCLSVVAYIFYAKETLSGHRQPNVSSWVVWALITVLNFTSYKKLTGDWVKSMLPTLNAGMCILTAILAIHVGSFRSLTTLDQACLGLGTIAGLVWWIFKSADFAQLIIQMTIAIGFVPILIGTWSMPSNESPLAWFIWTGAFTSQFFAVAYAWGGKKMEFLYPINMVVFHLLVFILTLL